jgi:large subunit ribosomal protein L23
VHKMPVLVRPLNTEKAAFLGENYGKVVFEVRLDATKDQIRHAVRSIYKVHVEKVRTSITAGHPRRRGQNAYKESSWKKAMVQLRKGDTIDFHAAE